APPPLSAISCAFSIVLSMTGWSTGPITGTLLMSGVGMMLKMPRPGVGVGAGGVVMPLAAVGVADEVEDGAGFGVGVVDTSGVGVAVGVGVGLKLDSSVEIVIHGKTIPSPTIRAEAGKSAVSLPSPK